MSYYDAFAPVYDAWSAHMTEDVLHYVRLAEEADSTVVELAVGNGRVAVPVAQATGRKVIGIDASEAMLAAARKRADGAGVADLLDLRLGDIRTFTLDEPVALVTCPFRSLLHLPTWDDKLAAFRAAHAALRPGGRFAWNAFVFSPFVAARNDGQWAEQNGIRHRVDHDPADNRVDVTLSDGASISLWWATRSEWEGLIATAGFEIEALYGGFERQPFDRTSSEFVWVARRPA